jgi:hypothetical protein
MRHPSAALLIGILSLCLQTSPSAQEIKVLEEKGQPIEEGGTTILRFESGDEVTINQVLAQSFASGYGWTAQGQTWRLLCTAPCTLEVPNGSYELKVGESPVFSIPFQVSARGGEQRWAVEDSNGWLGFLGIMGSGIGGGLALSGLLLEGLDTSDAGTGISGSGLLIVGVPVMVLGIWALVESFSDAEPIQ